MARKIAACGVLAVLFSAASAQGALAGDLIFTPINPSFGGYALNSSHLLALANAQNEPKSKADKVRAAEAAARAAARAAGVDKTDRFLQLLEAHLYSSLAQRVSEAIFNDKGPTTGTIKFNDQQVTFEKSLSEIKLAILDSTTGQITEIIVPTLVTQ